MAVLIFNVSQYILSDV